MTLCLVVLSVDRVLNDDECPLNVQAQWKTGEQRNFNLTRKVGTEVRHPLPYPHPSTATVCMRISLCLRMFVCICACDVSVFVSRHVCMCHCPALLVKRFCLHTSK